MMSYETLLSAFMGAVLAVMGFLLLVAGIAVGTMESNKYTHRVPILVLLGLAGTIGGLWLIYTMS